MSRSACALLCAIFLLSLCSPGLLRKTSHGYPHSTGLSGGGHKYPASQGLSGSGYNRQSYSAPSYTHQSHKPSATSGGNRPTYPDSPGLSGSGTGHGGYGGHGSSSSGGSHSYPPSHTGMSGNNYRGGQGHGSTNVHHHYHYNPPQQIHYSYGGAPARTYPVYHGAPPTYVYQYKDSSSKYGTLLTGLALLNLGMLTASTFSHRQNTQYKPQPGEVCKLGIRRENGDYEETKIKCDLISSFIWAEDERIKTQAANPAKNSTTSVVVTTNTTTTSVNNTAPSVAPQANPLYMMLPNGTLVPVNATLTNAPQPNGVVNGNVTTSVVTTVTNTTTTVADALDAKNNGPPVKVTDGMQCYVIRHTPTSNMRHAIPCGLLQTYASKSLTNAAARNVPAIVFTVAIAAFILS